MKFNHRRALLALLTATALGGGIYIILAEFVCTQLQNALCTFTNTTTLKNLSPFLIMMLLLVYCVGGYWDEK